MEIVQGVTLRLKTEGAGEAEKLAASVNRAGEAGRKAAGGLGETATATHRVGDQMRDASGRFATAAKGLNDVNTASHAAAGGINTLGSGITNGLFPAMFGAGVAAGLVVTAIQQVADVAVRAAQAVVRMWADAVADGIMFNGLIQTAVLSMAALLVSFGTFQTTMGTAVDATQQFAAAQVLAKDMVEQLRIAAMQTSATLPELINAMQMGMGPALQAGFNPAQVVNFTKVMAQAAATLGVHISGLGQEIRGVFDVDLSKNSRIAQAIFLQMGMSAEELRTKLNAMTSTERYDFLMDRLKGYAATSEQVGLTVQGSLSNLEDAYQGLMGAGMVEATDDFSSAVRSLAGHLVVVDAAGKSAFDPQLVEAIKTTYTALNDATAAVVMFIEAMGPLEFEEDNFFGVLAEAIKKATTELKVYAETYRLLREGHGAYAGPFQVIVALNNAADNVQADEAFWANERKNPRGRTIFDTGDTPDGLNYVQTPPPKDDADTAETLKQLERQLKVMEAQAVAAGKVNDLERARATMQVQILQAQDKAAKIMENLRDEASAEQRAAAQKLADRMREADISAAIATYQRKIGEEAERTVNALDQLHIRQEAILGKGEAQTQLEQKINSLLTERDKQLEALSKLSKLTDDEKMWEEARINAVFSQAITDAQTESLAEFDREMAEMMNDIYARRQDEIARQLTQNLDRMSERGRQLLEEMREFAQRDWNIAANTAGQAISRGIIDAATNAGKTLGEIAGQTFADFVSIGAEKMVEKLAVGVAGMFGDKITQSADGKWHVEGSSQTFDSAADAAATTRGGRLASGATAVAAAGYNGYQMGQTGEGGRTAAALGGALAGSAFGPWGAVIGAVVGYIGAVLGEKERQQDYKFGVPYVDARGQAHMWREKNMTDAEVQKAVAAAQETYNTIRNAYVKVFLALGSIMPEIGKIDGQFQDNPSSKYLKHLDEWLTQTLPREIAERVEGALRDSFTSYGMATAQFNRYLRDAYNLDPAKAAQFWADMATAVASWARADRAMQEVNQEVFAPVMPGSDYRWNNGRKLEIGEGEFEANTRAAGEGLFAIAREMVNMTGPDRAAAFARLGQGIESLTRDLQDFLGRVGQSLKNIQAMIHDAALQVELDQAPDNETRADILYREYNAIQSQLMAAAANGLTPEEVEALTQQGIALLQQMYALDPTAEMAAWMQRQLANLQVWSTDALNAIATQATNQVNELIASLEPFRQWMLGLPVDLDAAWDALDRAIRGAGTALDDLARRMEEEPPATDQPQGGGGPGAPFDDDPDGDPTTNPAVVTTTYNFEINLNAPVHGVDDLQESVMVAVREAIRRYPDAFEPATGGQ